MTRRSEPNALLYAIVFGLAVLLHLPILMLAQGLMRPTEETLDEAYHIEPVQLTSEEEERPEPEERQIVSLDKPEEPTEAPEEARFEDRYDQKVDKETVRKRDGRPPGRTSSPPTAGGKPATSPENDEEAKPEDTSPAEDTNQTPDGPSAPVDAPLEGPREPGNAAPDREDDGPGRLDLDPNRILPNWDNTVGQGGSGPKDYLDVEEGDKDLLNRKETRYWAFFDRVKTSVRRQWQPNTVYRANDPRGQIYGVQDRLTILHVTLKGDGSLHDMYVEKPSGLTFLDNEAMRAFRVAQPFPNPPEGLKDDEGLISFRFGFMFEIQSSGGRIIRYNR